MFPFTKKLTVKQTEVPASNEVKTIENVQLWYVGWISRDGDASWNTNKETEAFTSEQEANDFAQSLRNAFKLLRHTSNTRVVVRMGGKP